MTVRHLITLQDVRMVDSALMLMEHISVSVLEILMAPTANVKVSCQNQSLKLNEITQPIFT